MAEPPCATLSNPRSNHMAEQVTDATFESLVLKSDLPVLLDFWAPWCGPCRAVGPIIDELAKEYEGKVRVVKMNVDENPATPTKFGIRAIPTLVVFKNGETVEQITGAVTKVAMKELLDSKVLA
ncbi:MULTISPECIES: thioredoxin [unclassified Desulfovibrio]